MFLIAISSKPADGYIFRNNYSTYRNLLYELRDKPEVVVTKLDAIHNVIFDINNSNEMCKKKKNVSKK